MTNKVDLSTEIDPKYLNPNYYDPKWDQVVEAIHALSEEEKKSRINAYANKKGLKSPLRSQCAA
ncbi:MAG: hypothetical protein LBC43_02375 [Bifidobacteriaceae bacterium]|nr:hypothetical protein [Bifidobacteriaceae bacterium]